MFHVAFIVHPRALLTGLTIPLEMLRAADEIDRVSRREPSRLRVSIATTGDRAFEALGALTVVPQQPLAELRHVDLVFIPPFWRKPKVNLPAVIHQLVELEAQGASICAVSTGSFLLAEAGLLDGRAATTHWSFLNDFAERYPSVLLKRHHLITRSERLFCAGSLNATADLTAFFIERWLGTETARLVEAQFSPEIRQPVRQQGYFDGEINEQPDELMAVAQGWLTERLAGPVRVTELAKHLGVSQRSLNRRFQIAVGCTPGKYLRDLRVEAATGLLRNSNLSVAEIGVRVGYVDAGHFSTVYRRSTGRSPRAFRAAVRVKLFGSGVETAK